MSLIRVIKSEYKVVLLYIINTVVLVFTYNQLLSSVYVVYPLFLSTVLLVVYIGIKYHEYLSINNEIENLKIANYVPTYAKNLKDEMYLDVIESLHIDYNKKINELINKNKRNEHIFSMFIHNMKTSVSVIELASCSDSETMITDIQLENSKLKENLEQALNVLRFEEFSQDYVPEKVELLSMVRGLVNNNKNNFIYNNIFPKLSGEETYVYTDKKWCMYMLEQILSNAIKYSNDGGTVYLNIKSDDEKTYVEIIDTGVGIPASDIDRVFELFYTGSNGRDNSNSTGIGLSMVKSIASVLGHKVELESEVGVGSKVVVGFEG